jgi:hypothetical protein
MATSCRGRSGLCTGEPPADLDDIADDPLAEDADLLGVLGKEQRVDAEPVDAAGCGI